MTHDDVHMHLDTIINETQSEGALLLLVHPGGLSKHSVATNNISTEGIVLLLEHALLEFKARMSIASALSGEEASDEQLSRELQIIAGIVKETVST